MRAVTTNVIFVLWLASTGIPTLAHHSAQAEFDTNKAIQVTGVLSKIEYENPHCYFYIDAKGGDGKTVTWSFEGQPPSFMHRAGFTREFMMGQIGRIVSIDASPAKDGTKNFGLGHALTLPDGRVIPLWPRDAEK